MQKLQKLEDMCVLCSWLHGIDIELSFGLNHLLFRLKAAVNQVNEIERDECML